MGTLKRVDLEREHPQGLYKEVNAIKVALLGPRAVSPKMCLNSIWIILN